MLGYSWFDAGDGRQVYRKVETKAEALGATGTDDQFGHHVRSPVDARREILHLEIGSARHVQGRRARGSRKRSGAPPASQTAQARLLGTTVDGTPAR